jgi:multisubunit Na+/H+ antiporter MnhG subunit
MHDLRNQRSQRYFPSNITKEQAKDTGMAIVLICLIIYLIWEKEQLIIVATTFLILNMVWSGFYRPVAKIWLGFSHILGTIISKFLLSILFFVLVTPVGLIRRMGGADSLQLKKWKKNNTSIFKFRNHTYSAKDIKKPY